MMLLHCDAGASLGVGHLMRCLALASAAKKWHMPVAICGNVVGEFAETELELAGIRYFALGQQELVTQAERVGAALVHVDHYGEFPQLRERLNRRGILLSSMEDGEFGRRPADIVIDPTLGAETGDRPTDGSSVLVRGLQWAPVRPDVIEARHRYSAQAAGEESRVIVVMGGTDACDAIRPVALALARCATPMRVTVIAPERRVSAVHAALPNAEVLAPTRLLPRIAAAADLVVTAAGTTVWEMACIGVPTALVAVTKNQRVGYRQAIASGIAIGLGEIEQVRDRPAETAEKLDELLADPFRRRNISAVARRTADGRGAIRTVELWRLLTATNCPLQIRSAVPTDRSLIHSWQRGWKQQVKTVRHPHDRGGHWNLESSGPARQVYLGIAEDRDPVGAVRFGRAANRTDDWDVELVSAPKALVGGAVVQLLLESERAWRSWVALANTAQTLPPRRLVAILTSDDEALKRAFERAGYQWDRTLEGPAMVKQY